MGNNQIKVKAVKANVVKSDSSFFEEQALLTSAEAKLAEETRLQLEAEAKIKMAEAKLAEEVRLKAEAEAKAKIAEAKRAEESRLKAESRENVKAEKVRLKTETAVKEKAEAEAKQAEEARLAEEAHLKAETVAKEKAEAEAKAAEEARLKAEAEVKTKEAEAKRAEETKRAEEARLSIEKEAKAKAKAEAKAAEEARLRAEAEAKTKEAEAKIAEETKRAEEARLAIEKEAKAKAEAEAKSAKEKRLTAEAEAKTKEAEAKRAEETKRTEEARLKAETAAKEKAEAEAKLAEETRLAEEARLKAETAAKEKAEAEAKLAEETRLAEEARLKVKDANNDIVLNKNSGIIGQTADLGNKKTKGPLNKQDDWHISYGELASLPEDEMETIKICGFYYIKDSAFSAKLKKVLKSYGLDTITKLKQISPEELIILPDINKTFADEIDAFFLRISGLLSDETNEVDVNKRDPDESCQRDNRINKEDVYNYLASVKVPITKGQILNHFPDLNVQYLNKILKDKDILNYRGQFILYRSFEEDSNDYNYLSNLLNAKTGHNDLVHINDLYNVVQKERPSLMPKYCVYKEYAFFSLLERMFQDEYVFSRPYITKAQSEMKTTNEILREWLRSKDVINIADFLAYSKKKHASIGGVRRFIKSFNDEFLILNAHELIPINSLDFNEQNYREFEDILNKKVEKYILAKEAFDEGLFNTSLERADEWFVYSIVDKWGEKFHALASKGTIDKSVPFILRDKAWVSNDEVEREAIRWEDKKTNPIYNVDTYMDSIIEEEIAKYENI